jgi:hypothetical protein
MLHSAYLPACIGLVLALTSQLDQLDILESYDSHISLESMFGMRKHGEGIQFTSIRSLRSLTSLKLSAKDLDDRWCGLPKLCVLELDLTGPFTASGVAIESAVSFDIQSLTLRTTTDVFVDSPRDNALCNLLKQFRGVKFIHIKYTNWSTRKTVVGDLVWTSHLSGNWGSGSFSHLLDSLGPLLQTLESLKTTSLDGGEYDSGNYLKPLEKLHFFLLLKALSLPRVALVNAIYESDDGKTHPVEVLPRNLKSLTIYDPYLSTLEWLGPILERRSKVPNLEKVMLDFQHSPISTIQGFDTSKTLPIIRF